MARAKKRHQRPPIRRSDPELMADIQRNLTSLQLLADVYDRGHPGIAGEMATLVEKIFVNTRAAAEDRGRRAFPSPVYDDTPTNLAAYHHAVGLVIGGDPVAASFFPMFAMTPDPPAHQRFKVWWESEPIYRASAAKPDGPANLIPLVPEEQVPYAERERFTRQGFVNDLRNAVGSHASDTIPALLNDLYQTGAFGAEAAVQIEGRVLSLSDGTLPLKVGTAEAIMRQIAEEVLMAFGLRPNDRWSDYPFSAEMEEMARGLAEERRRRANAD